MKARAAVLAGLFTFCAASPALAWDPERTTEPGPIGPGSEPWSDPEPFIAPPGIYYVTDTYVADVVTTNGPLTTYSTETVHESTGSYARVLGDVGTGDESVFDGTSFNGRARLTDGREVAGTYYENYVLTADGFVPVSVVFFQDDAELARQRQLNTRSGGAPGDTVALQPQIAAPTSECCATRGTAEVTSGSRADHRDEGPRDRGDSGRVQIRRGSHTFRGLARPPRRAVVSRVRRWARSPRSLVGVRRWRSGRRSCARRKRSDRFSHRVGAPASRGRGLWAPFPSGRRRCRCGL